MKFPYLEFEGKYLPVVPIRIKGKELVEFKAFVDSGAGYSIFKASAGEILGMTIEAVAKAVIKMINPIPTPALIYISLYLYIFSRYLKISFNTCQSNK